LKEWTDKLSWTIIVRKRLNLRGSLFTIFSPLNWSLLSHVQYQQLKLVMDSIIWAFRHTERNIAETGLNLLLEMLKNFQVCPPPPPTLYSVQSSISCHVRCLLFCVIWQASEFCNQFYRSYFLTIEQEIFAVLTDTFHKPGFKLHVLVLQHLFCSVCVLQLSFS